MLDVIVKNEGEPDVVQLSGGELPYTLSFSRYWTMPSVYRYAI